MKKIIIASMLMLGLTAQANAGDPQAGKDKAAPCAACHGADGNSAAAAFPKLAGLGHKYLAKQIRDIKSGARPVAQMAGQTDNLSDQDIEDIAAFYASQPITPGATDPELLALGEKIYRAGDLEKGIAACTACHSPMGKGNDPAGYPALGGQHADYIAAQLKAFQLGQRVNDGDTQVMREIAYRLSDKEIEAVSSYVSGLK